MRGRISQWNDDKGFGFILSEDGGDKIFFHISAVKNRGRRPRVDDDVLYESRCDSRGRMKASSVVLSNAESTSTAHRERRIHTEPKKRDALDYFATVLLIGSIGALVTYLVAVDTSKMVASGVVLVIAIALLCRQKAPNEVHFTCAGCRKTSQHDTRTIRAWNNGFIKLYCSVCHRKWLAEHAMESQNYSISSRGGGCLGVLILFVIFSICAFSSIAMG